LPSFDGELMASFSDLARSMSSIIAILRQLSARVCSETPNAFTNRIWRPANSELSSGGGGLLLEPLANH
jgi:hypothetical protein